jgi:hypothetical protein
MPSANKIPPKMATTGTIAAQMNFLAPPGTWVRYSQS